METLLNDGTPRFCEARQRSKSNGNIGHAILLSLFISLLIVSTETVAEDDLKLVLPRGHTGAHQQAL